MVKVCGEEPEDVFVDEFINEDGDRKYEDLTFYTENYAICAKNFLERDDINISAKGAEIAYADIRWNNYDFENPTDKSRLHIDVRYEIEVEAVYRASKENCNSLRDMFFKYIKPYLVE